MIIPIIATCVLLVWFGFWVMGNIWAALIMAALPVVLKWDLPAQLAQRLTYSPNDVFFLLIVFVAAFAPWSAHYRKARRRARAERERQDTDAVAVSVPTQQRSLRQTRWTIASRVVVSLIGVALVYYSAVWVYVVMLKGPVILTTQ